MSNIKFVINTIKREKEIVGMTNKHIDFLKTNRIIFTLPEKQLEKEYSIEKYRKYKKWLEVEWKKREEKFAEKLLSFFHKPERFRFIVEISNYGPLGFYNVKNNTITINLNTRLDVINTIKHEMVHIMLESFIKKYNIEHNRKEFIVDTVLGILEGK